MPLGKLLFESYRQYLRADQRACVAAVENLWGKYAVTAKQIETARDDAAKVLQAARENTSASARSRDKSFFMFGYFLSNFFFFARSLKSAAIQERARTRRTQFISNSHRETWTKSFRYPQNR